MWYLKGKNVFISLSIEFIKFYEDMLKVSSVRQLLIDQPMRYVHIFSFYAPKFLERLIISSSAWDIIIKQNYTFSMISEPLFSDTNIDPFNTPPGEQ